MFSFLFIFLDMKQTGSFPFIAPTLTTQLQAQIGAGGPQASCLEG